MFCPNCRSEYREGFTQCADCEIALVHELDAAPRELDFGGSEEDDRLVRLHETRNPEELGLLAELLEDERVPYAVQAGTALSLFSGGVLSGGEPDAWEARIFVHAPAAPRVARLLIDLREGRVQRRPQAPAELEPE